MLVAEMDPKTLAITPPLLLLSSFFFFFHLRGAAFGSSKAFHCLLLLSCLLLSSVNTLHNLADYDSLGSNIAERFQSFNGGGVAAQNVCPSSDLFSLLPALGSEHQFDPVVTFFRHSSPGKSRSSSSSLASNNNNLSGVVWLSLKPVHIIEFQPFSRIGGGTTPLSKELFANKKNTRELSISVSGKQCGGGNGLMEQKQCEEGLSSEPGDSIKFLFFYQTELSCAYGVAVFAVPAKSTAPVLMLTLCKKPVSWWLRAKKLCIALLIAVALLILILCFNDHFIEEERNNIAVSKVEKKPSTITISLEMDTLLRSISKETLQVSNEVVSENSVKPVSSSSSCQVETSELTVKTAKDKKRRRNKKKKKKGAVSELTTTDVSSSQSGNSTPRSPMSPAVVVTHQAATKPTTPTKPVLSHSATFPVSVAKSVMIIQGSSLAPDVRAPGAKPRSEVKEEEEYRCYDIWGDHLTGLHLMDRFKEVREGRSSSNSSSCFGEDDEFVSLFVKGPHHNLLPGSHAKPMCLLKK